MEKGCGLGSSGFAFRRVRFGVPVRSSGNVNVAAGNVSVESIV